MNGCQVYAKSFDTVCFMRYDPFGHPYAFVVWFIINVLAVQCSCLVDYVVHNCEFIMGAMASQITSLASVDPIVHSGADQRKHQSSKSLAFVRGIHRWPVHSPYKWPVTRKMFHLMTSSCHQLANRCIQSTALYHTVPMNLIVISITTVWGVCVILACSDIALFISKRIRDCYDYICWW